MKILMIASGYLPYLFSENLCNGKLVYALTEAGHEVDVISQVHQGAQYGSEWTEPWTKLKNRTYLMEYHLGNKIERLADVVYSGIKLGVGIEFGVRWVRRAYEIALKMVEQNHYDAVLTRSPNELSHIVGYKLKKKTGIKWIANWNDPAETIWPGMYEMKMSNKRKAHLAKYEVKMLASADVVTFPSDSLRQHFMKHFPFLKDRNTEIIPHIAMCDSLWENVKLSNRCDSSGKMLMLHSGNLSIERDPENTFKALRQLIDEGFNQFEFHIMGSMNEFTEAKIKKYNLEDSVKFIGSYPFFEAIGKMSGYDVLVLLEAILPEGIFFPSKLVDYAQIGLPILAISPKKGFANSISGRSNNFFSADNESVEDIKEAIKNLILIWEDGAFGKGELSHTLPESDAECVVNQYTKIIGE